VAPLRDTFDRRSALKLLALAIGNVALGAHTPYGQWTVYRQRNLFIVASRTDRRAIALATALASGLAQELPESHARMTRASDTVRIASLLATEQLDVAIVSREEAAEMREGVGEYAAVGPFSLCALAELGRHVLVTVESFKTRHAYLLAANVEHLRSRLPIAPAARQPQSSLPLHLGANAYYAGETMPEQADPDALGE
jgi:hypothetical protein